MAASPSRVLYIEEILHYILSNFDATNKTCGRSTLTNVARCCKAFLNPALDILWKRLENPGPLIKLLPIGDSQASVQTTNIFSDCSPSSDAPLDPTKDIGADDWTRFDMYAKRVRVLFIPKLGCEDISLFRRLEAARPGIHLLPSLRVLHLVDARSLPSTIPFVSPTLRDVLVSQSLFYTDFNRSDIAWGSMLDDLVSKHVLLERLTLSGVICTSSTLSASRLQTLRALEITGTVLEAIDIHTVSRLGTLDHLTELTLGGVSVTGAVDITPFVGFRSLESIRFATNGGEGSLSVAVRVLAMISSRTLHTVIVQGACEPTADWSRFFDALRSRWSSSLRYVNIEDDVPDDIAAMNLPPQSTSIIPMIRPLLDLSQLEGFRMVFKNPPSGLTDADVDRISSAWPKLRSLELSFPLAYSQQAGIGAAMESGVRSLVSIASHCPDLLHLSLGHFHYQAESGLSGITPPPRFHGLESLRLETAGIRDYFKLALILNHIFPALVEVCEEGGYFHSVRREHTQLSTAVHRIQTARKHGERTLISSSSN